MKNEGGDDDDDECEGGDDDDENLSNLSTTRRVTCRKNEGEKIVEVDFNSYMK